MANAALGLTNLADAGTVTVSGSVAGAGADRLIASSPHVGEKWRINATSGYVQIDLGASLSIDSVMLAGVTSNLAASSPTFRVRGGPNADMSSPAFDTGSISGLPYYDPTEDLFVYLRAAVSVRYIRIDISEAATAYIEAGRVGVFLKSQFGINFAAPASLAFEPGTEIAIGAGGQSYPDQRPGHVSQALTFEFASAAERAGFLKTLGRGITAGHKDFLLIPDPDSTNLSFDCKWGYQQGSLVLTQDKYLVPPVYSVTINHRERL